LAVVEVCTLQCMFEKILSLETYKDNNVKKNMRAFLTGDPTLSTFSEQLLLLG